MRWKIDDYGRLVISVTKREQRSLQAAQRRDEEDRCDPPFDSEDFLHELFETMTTNDEFAWLAEGITDDLTSAPMLGILGDEMPGPNDPQDAIGMGLVLVGCWHHAGRPRHIYQPVLRRWAFMSYAMTSPQRELAENGVCTWDGGEFWQNDEAAKKALAEFEPLEIEAQA